MIKLFLSIVSFTVFVSCSSLHQTNRNYKKMSLEEKALIDSIFAKALDHEALYTLLDTLKPISSIKFYKLPLLSTNKEQADSASAALFNLQNAINKLNSKTFSFILNPFERKDSIYKNFELYVVRNKKLATAISNQKSFYNAIGISPLAKPETVLAITEYENKYNRWRSYGFLFGYPNYAVDFFVKAGKIQDSTNQFVKRDFFAIPVFAGDRGHFTYAIPKDYKTNEADSTLYNTALATLNKYKTIRLKYEQSNGLQATQLFLKYSKK
jgi:hypothetical protein